ncbi:GNAT family N-acetyltransferase [Periweissella fabalis]|uniref:GNAT family N-acetyltransferase n=1 Tax=Periweissella fabalis TaxID=1070421 RepID=A0A7X6N6E8_9LACO|nr:GNAT family N-acetyltransferase [Periweissella fabalis]MCM0598215.1 GNAT family N-acetyltransferase [Periweissella fabalis]NKZ24850.1 GNAT family N-acetyltransferase [Periweissella fabalis]
MSELKLQVATVADLPIVMKITNQAKALLKADGINQWQMGYPSEVDFENDMKEEHLYVAKLDDETVGFIALIDGLDQAYQIIENGAWLNNDEPYYTIHRVAVSSDASGQKLGERMLRAAVEKSLELGPDAKSVRVDTHPDNKRMQYLLNKIGFVLTGHIFINDGELRYAYEYMR